MFSIASREVFSILILRRTYTPMRSNQDTWWRDLVCRSKWLIYENHGFNDLRHDDLYESMRDMKRAYDGMSLLIAQAERIPQLRVPNNSK